MLVPPGNADEAALIDGLTVRTSPNLKQLVEQQLNGTHPCIRICPCGCGGRHHLLLVGPPGCGKSRLAHQLPQLLQPLVLEEALTIARIRFVADEQQDPLEPLRKRPFRGPHHSCSAAALLGGGHNPRPGELSLAHGGVLFLDELAEFQRAVLDQLRQALEEGVYHLSRARLKTNFPVEITLVAATNPCPCGWHADRDHGCRCSSSQSQRYWQKLSGPLLDRLDLQLRLEQRSATAIQECLNPGALATQDEWLDPRSITSARQRMTKRNPEGGCNRDLTAHGMGNQGGLRHPRFSSWSGWLLGEDCPPAAGFDCYGWHSPWRISTTQIM